MEHNFTEEQKQMLQRTLFDEGMTFWEWLQTREEDDQPLFALGIISCLKKGRPLNSLTLFWEIEDLGDPPEKHERPMCQHEPSKELEEKLTEEQKQQIQGLTLEGDMKAWEYVLSCPDDDQYWVALGILSCVEHDYGLNRLVINWEARDIRYAQSPAASMEITAEQKLQLRNITLSNDTNAWEYVMQEKENDRYWVALGILSCIEHGYGLTMLEINSEARRLRRNAK